MRAGHLNPRPCSFLCQGFEEEWAEVQTLFEVIFEDADLLAINI
jgi:23S rRNA-/tRNA-specific pseudouridylate synthase